MEMSVEHHLTKRFMEEVVKNSDQFDFQRMLIQWKGKRKFVEDLGMTTRSSSSMRSTSRIDCKKVNQRHSIVTIKSENGTLRFCYVIA